MFSAITVESFKARALLNCFRGEKLMFKLRNTTKEKKSPNQKFIEVMDFC